MIAILALNEATEVADLLVAYGVLRQGKIAEVNVVAERAEPIQLYPGDLSIEPQTTARAFDERYLDGADYVVVVWFELGGQSFMALNGGPTFNFNQPVSLMVHCESREEIDTVAEDGRCRCSDRIRLRQDAVGCPQTWMLSGLLGNTQGVVA